MGVPIFAILLGFVVGWVSPSIYKELFPQSRLLLRRSLFVAFLISVFTMLLMIAIWAPSILKLWDPAFDLSNYGIPMILYETEASFIGWMVLMIIISPVLQFLAVVTMSTIRIAFLPPLSEEIKDNGK